MRIRDSCIAIVTAHCMSIWLAATFIAVHDLHRADRFHVLRHATAAISGLLGLALTSSSRHVGDDAAHRRSMALCMIHVFSAQHSTTFTADRGAARFHGCATWRTDASLALSGVQTHANTSNQAMQRTAGRSAITLSMIPTPLVFATRALARGR